MDYCHHIESEAKTASGGAPVMSIGEWISLTAWLGISGGLTQWEYLIEEEIDLASDAVMRFCRRFIAAAPQLLAGLEFERITER